VEPVTTGRGPAEFFMMDFKIEMTLHYHSAWGQLAIAC
jgi:hypothetical protein